MNHSPYNTAMCLMQVLSRFNALCVKIGDNKITLTEVQVVLDLIASMGSSTNVPQLVGGCKTGRQTQAVMKIVSIHPLCYESEQRLAIKCGMIFVSGDTVVLETSGSIKPFFPQQQIRITQ